MNRNDSELPLSRSSAWPVWPAALLVCILAAAAGPAAAEDEVPSAKRTDAGLYMTSLEAYEKWLADPEGVKVIDVRTPEEYMFVGHAPMAINIPLLLVDYAWKADLKRLAMHENQSFLSDVEKRFAKNDLLVVMCRSGNGSAPAVNKLTAAGFTNVYNILDGFEGDKVDDPGSYFHKKRVRNGWKNSGAPWGYDLNADLMILPQE